MADPADTSDTTAVGLEANLGHAFRRPELLRQALTHSSAAHEDGDLSGSGERLEFLGDAVLGVIVSAALLAAAPQADEGVLSRWRASLVRASHLAEVSVRVGLGPFQRLGKGEQASGGRHKESILADACEAVIGALYLDGGWAVATAFVTRYWGDAMRRCVEEGPGSRVDAKSALQERLQGRGDARPVYRLIGASGPDHRRRFRVEVRTAAGVLASGSGGSKREAEQVAAAEALARLASP